MKTKIQRLISEYHIRISALKADRETAQKLSHNFQATAITSKINTIEEFIDDLAKLLG